MHRTNIVKVLLALGFLVSALGLGASGSANAAGYGNAVYTLTNQAAGNAVAVFNRASDGTLTPQGTYSTGGLGTGAGLGSQGALAVNKNNKWLFAVNAGSNEISVLSIDPVGVTLVDKVASGGTRPISLTSAKDLLYVLNAGGTGNITGFKVGGDGQLTPLAGSTRPLSSGAAGPAQVQFSPNGKVIVVTEKATNRIDTYTVDRDGIATGPSVHPSAGTTPFGFAFGKSGKLFVSEAFGGAANGSAASSYDVDKDGSISTISPSVTTHQTAACWLVVTKDEQYTYTANTGSGSISGYSIDEDGSISLLNADGRTGVTGDGSSPVDLALNGNSRFLYALTSGSHAINAFRVGNDGSLTPIAGATALPVGTIGLIAK